ncbi:hypothetical protein WR25_09785 isoform E [Diploscapter pachys]|nr:hypothetical protein WR25_09785 isoform E [Diploscapter pachys]
MTSSLPTEEILEEELQRTRPVEFDKMTSLMNNSTLNMSLWEGMMRINLGRAIVQIYPIETILVNYGYKPTKAFAVKYTPIAPFMDERVDPLDDERIRDHCDDNCLCIVLYYTMAFAASRLLPNTELVRDDHTANLASLYTEYTNGDMSSYTSFAYMGGISAMLNDLAGLLNALPARTLFHLTYDSSMSEVLGSLLLDQLTVKFKQYKLVCNGMKDSPISQMNQLFNCRALSGANRMIEPGKIRVVMTYHGSADANFAIHPFVSKAKSVAITLHKMIPLPWLLRMECPELDLWMHRDVPTIPWITPVESCYGFLHIVGIILVRLFPF